MRAYCKLTSSKCRIIGHLLNSIGKPKTTTTTKKPITNRGTFPMSSNIRHREAAFIEPTHLRTKEVVELKKGEVGNFRSADSCPFGAQTQAHRERWSNETRWHTAGGSRSSTNSSRSQPVKDKSSKIIERRLTRRQQQPRRHRKESEKRNLRQSKWKVFICRNPYFLPRLCFDNNELHAARMEMLGRQYGALQPPQDNCCNDVGIIKFTNQTYVIVLLSQLDVV